MILTRLLVVLFLALPHFAHAAFWDSQSDLDVCYVTDPGDSTSDWRNSHDKATFNWAIKKYNEEASTLSRRTCGKQIILKTNVTLTAPLKIDNDNDDDGLILRSSDGKNYSININHSSSCGLTLASDSISVKNLKFRNAGSAGLCVASQNNHLTSLTVENNKTGISVTGTQNKISQSIIRNNSSYGIKLDNHDGNEASNNSYYGNGTALVSTLRNVSPDISALYAGDNYQLFMSLKSDVDRIEIHRTYPKVGTSTLLDVVENISGLSHVVSVEATSGESVYALAFQNGATSDMSPTVLLSQFSDSPTDPDDSDGSGDTQDGSKYIGSGYSPYGCDQGAIDPSQNLKSYYVQGVGYPDYLDTDCDGIFDADEDIDLDGRWDSNETNFLNSDTDSDGLIDGLEDRNQNGRYDSGTETNALLEDTDGDQIPDGVEDFDQNGLLGSYESSPIKADTDGDGIDDSVEDANHNGKHDTGETKAYVADTDNDGLSDGQEDANTNGLVDANESDPRLSDTDEDGLTDLDDDCPLDNDLSCQYACSPGESMAAGVDTDMDGLEDCYEDINNNCIVDAYESDPRKNDTDGDALSDRYDPCPSNPDLTCVHQCLAGIEVAPTKDSDSDGLPDVDEDQNGNCIVDGGETDSYNADTDGDGIKDGIEMQYGLDPTRKDTDYDGLYDMEEDLNGDGRVQTGETDPNDSDTDDDGIADGTDACPLTKSMGENGTDTCENECYSGVIPSIRKDSDQDGIADRNEDADNDCFVDPSETDAYNSDSDGDGLGDGIEDANTNGVRDEGETDPTVSDTDNDGIVDGAEDVNQNGIYDYGELSPLSGDTDGDGIPDNLEDKNLNGKWDTDSETSGFLKDSDYDGLDDGVEDSNFNGRRDAGETDPRLSDTDGDGAYDGGDPNAINANSTDLDHLTGQKAQGGCHLTSGSNKNYHLAAWFILLPLLVLAIVKRNTTVIGERNKTLYLKKLGPWGRQ